MALLRYQGFCPNYSIKYPSSSYPLFPGSTCEFFFIFDLFPIIYIIRFFNQEFNSFEYLCCLFPLCNFSLHFCHFVFP